MCRDEISCYPNLIIRFMKAIWDSEDTVKAESILMNLTNIFPDDKTITLQLIDLYIKSNKNEEALKYIKVAKENDPNNYSLFFAAGILFLNQNRYDEAIAELSKSIELKSDLYDTQYGLGASYINKSSRNVR